jgi:hypothetical protein
LWHTDACATTCSGTNAYLATGATDNAAIDADTAAYDTDTDTDTDACADTCARNLFGYLEFGQHRRTSRDEPGIHAVAQQCWHQRSAEWTTEAIVANRL